jgi:hypothetical protein
LSAYVSLDHSRQTYRSHKGPHRCAAQAKASCQHDPAGRPYRSFPRPAGALGHLDRNQVRYTGTPVTIPMLTELVSTQRQVF